MLRERGANGVGEEHTPKIAKSIAMTTTVKIQAKTPRIRPTRLPKKPPTAMRAARKAKPQAIGWRMNEPVRPLAVLRPTVLKSVPSIDSITSTGL